MLLAFASGLVLSFIGSIPLAGPVSVVVFGRGLRDRFRSGMAIAVGAALAESLYALFAYWGLSALVERFPILTGISRVAAAAILLGLGVAFLAAYGRPRPPPPAPKERSKRSFVLGFTISALNPTFLATWTAAIAVLHSTGLAPRDTAAAPPFAVGVLAGTSAWFWVMLRLLRAHKDRFQPQTLNRILQAIGVALVGMGLVLGVRVALALTR